MVDSQARGRERDEANTTGELGRLADHLERMTELGNLVERLSRDILPDTERFESEQYVLEVRLWLEQAMKK